MNFSSSERPQNALVPKQKKRNRKGRTVRLAIIMKNPIPKDRNFNVRIIITGVVADPAAGYAFLEIRANDLFGPSATTFGTGSAVTTQVLGSAAGFGDYSLAHLEAVMVEVDLVSNVTGTGSYVSHGFSDQQPSTLIVSYPTSSRASVSQNVLGLISLGETNANSAAKMRSKPVFMRTVVGRAKTYDSNLEFDGSDLSAPNQAIWYNLLLRALAAGTVCSCLVNIVLYCRFNFYSPKMLI